jgi:undecaprenyl diphosphate synthase
MQSTAENLKAQIDPNRLPRHVAIIMDGNGRWAKQRGGVRIFGHKNAVQAVREVTEAAAEIGLEFLTLYTFSTENWKRPKDEVSGLMQLLLSTTRKELATLLKNNIRLQTIGDLSRVPEKTRQVLLDAVANTAGNTRMTLTLALNYGGRADLLSAVRTLAARVQEGQLGIEEIDEDIFTKALSTSGMPEPELMIRTSGEYRISNFMLWELAYSELYITPTLWPDFRKADFYEAICSFQQRERRFGLTGEQVQAK